MFSPTKYPDLCLYFDVLSVITEYVFCWPVTDLFEVNIAVRTNVVWAQIQFSNFYSRSFPQRNKLFVVMFLFRIHISLEKIRYYVTYLRLAYTSALFIVRPLFDSYLVFHAPSREQTSKLTFFAINSYHSSYSIIISRGSSICRTSRSSVLWKNTRLCARRGSLPNRERDAKLKIHQ